jgi:hypothetical protein
MDLERLASQPQIVSDLVTLFQSDIADAFGQLVGDAEFLGRERDLNHAIGDDFIGDLLTVNPARSQPVKFVSVSGEFGGIFGGIFNCNFQEMAKMR